MNPQTETPSFGVALPGEHADDLLRRPEAAKYLRRRYGIGSTAANLSTMAGRGNGPTYRKLMGTCIYRRGDIDAWIIAKISAPIELRESRVRRSNSSPAIPASHSGTPLTEPESRANAA